MRLRQFEIDIVHSSAIEHQAADALYPLAANGTNETLLDENVSALILASDILAQRWKALKQNENENVTNGRTAEVPVPFLPKAVVLAD